jgi:hypothetical protein
MEKTVYEFTELESIVNGWIRQTVAEAAQPDQRDLFGKISACDIEGAPV